MASVKEYSFIKMSHAGSAYIYFRFRYGKSFSRKQLIMRISDHHRHIYKTPVDFDMIKESDCPTDVFIENCVTEIKSYIHDFKMGNDNERPEQGVSAKPDNRHA
jgi:hypothetical protein